MVKTNYSGLNPIVVQALNNLQYRYSGETPEMYGANGLVTSND